jgi:hypothetical protein
MAGGAARRPDAGLWLLAAALLVYGLESWRMPPQYDDAFISYRYAANWLAGQGLVFNPGEFVEGFSNLLWTLLVAGGMALGLPAQTVGHALGLVSGAGALVATWLYARALRPELPSVWAGVAAWTLLASAAFARWAVSGMETPLFAALVAAALAADARARHGLATGLALLATLTRPEGALVAASLFGFRVLAGGLRDRALRRDVLAYAAGCAALTLFRVAYYGDPLPNTFYAKTGGIWLSLGAWFAAAFLLGNAGACALPAVAAVRHERRSWPGAAFAAVFLLYGVSIGGTPRYLTPLVPALAALGAVGAGLWWQRGGSLRIAGAAAIAASLVLCGIGSGPLLGRPLRDALAAPARTHGIAAEQAADGTNEQLALRRVAILRQRGAPVAAVATGAIGAFGFHSRLPIVDILGVIDPVVARSPVPPDPLRIALPGHQRSNPDYVLSRAPDYVLISNGEGPQQLPDWVPAVTDLRAHRELARHYDWDPEIVGYRRVR